MAHIGAFDAKTHFSSLLDRVENGEEIVITKHGKPVALMTAADAGDRSAATAAFEKLRTIRKTATLGGLAWKDLRDEGRR